MVNSQRGNGSPHATAPRAVSGSTPSEDCIYYLLAKQPQSFGRAGYQPNLREGGYRRG